MGIYLSANKDSQATTVSMDDVRSFITAVLEVNETISAARADLKKALEEDEQIDILKVSIDMAKETLEKYIEGHSVYKAYKEKIEFLKEEKSNLIAEAKEQGMPKKEIDVAIKALKSDIDLDVSTEIYANVSDLIE